MRHLIKRAGLVFSGVLFLSCTTKAPVQTPAAAAKERNTVTLTDITVPSASPLINSYFTQTMAASLDTRSDYAHINFNMNGFKVPDKGEDEEADDTMSFQANMTLAIKVWLVSPDSNAPFKFAIPLYYGMGGIRSDTVKDAMDPFSIFAGSGLHIITDYVSLYGFAAYRLNEYNDRNAYDAAYQNWEESGVGRQPVKKDYGYRTHGFLWSVMPVVTAKNIPLLGSVFSLFDAYLTLGSDADEFRPSYQARALFRDIPAGNARIGLAAITGSDWYNSLDAKHTVYGGRLGFQSASYGSFKVSVIAEGGYRTFFDVAAENGSFYQDGPYGRLFLGLSAGQTAAGRGGANYYLMVEMSRQNWPLPKIGIMGTLNEEGMWEGMLYMDVYEDDRSKGMKIACSTKDMYGNGNSIHPRKKK